MDSQRSQDVDYDTTLGLVSGPVTVPSSSAVSSSISRMISRRIILTPWTDSASTCMSLLSPRWRASYRHRGWTFASTRLRLISSSSPHRSLLA